MNATLPPERDLPALRHAEIRQHVVRAVQRPPQRRTARWLVPAGAAAAMVAVVALATTVGTVNGPPDLAPTDAAGGGPSVATMPGVDADRAGEIARECERAFRTGGKAPSATGAQELRLYNLITDTAGAEALLYGSQLVVSCTVGGDGSRPTTPGSVQCDPRLAGPSCTDGEPAGPTGPYRATGGPPATHLLDWLPGPVVVDVMTSVAATTSGGGPRPGFEELGGRVSRDVARVTVSFGDHTEGARVVNGTFLVRWFHPAGWQGPVDQPGGTGPRTAPGAATMVVRAYDSSGKLLAEVEGNPEGCYVTPDGELVYGASTDPSQPEYRDPATCKPATRWRPAGPGPTTAPPSDLPTTSGSD